MSHESPSIGADAQTDVLIPANTKRNSHVYLDLRVGGRLMRREGSLTRSTTAEVQHNDQMMRTNVQHDLRHEMALESMWICQCS